MAIFNDFKKSSSNSGDASGEKNNLKRDISKPENNWGNDVVGGLIQTELTSLTNEIAWLKILKKEIAPDCKHPKEDRDLDPETKMPYCMACNLYL